jgi:hypothetical protein
VAKVCDLSQPSASKPAEYRASARWNERSMPGTVTAGAGVVLSRLRSRAPALARYAWPRPRPSTSRRPHPARAQTGACKGTVSAGGPEQLLSCGVRDGDDRGVLQPALDMNRRIWRCDPLRRSRYSCQRSLARSCSSSRDARFPLPSASPRPSLRTAASRALPDVRPARIALGRQCFAKAITRNRARRFPPAEKIYSDPANEWAKFSLICL